MIALVTGFTTKTKVFCCLDECSLHQTNLQSDDTTTLDVAQSGLLSGTVNHLNIISAVATILEFAEAVITIIVEIDGIVDNNIVRGSDLTLALVAALHKAMLFNSSLLVNHIS